MKKVDGTMFSVEMMDRVIRSGIIAVLELERIEDAVPVTDALLAGGVSAIELTLRTPAALGSIGAIARNRPEMTIGVGTVLFVEQVKQIIDAGAHFAVAPGFNPLIVDEAKRLGIPFSPGIVTPSELEGALSKGCRLLKFFPAEPSGGVEYLKSMNNPYAYLGLSYIPLGGVNLANLPQYAAMKEVVAIGGTWISQRKLINEHAWDEITSRAKEAKRVWHEVRNSL
ncbi:MAG: bifunctional 4-hydroxy-2-oxoglutarate aldolase/2-dehydro-3-deoxy-phosphogluconate aldolase [Sphaerochaeta associata]|uniref:bifunctional 4-hydroxy-2-oxoglutarate aldolase/2-dehydro-3-deoxy-phosphogluconate aldolase n=1 Tax=Sphaerochaeta associata TaxID=1129264 RepID=UPI002B20B501|nr:bifunctional 4-hydroxy-2-oxoglutarate aldolase/2-dehydro-3-deoxy-phosphogluconate aldolase [Sphaerochaeta associata]MEA5108767.1 bifunctional 4-hydroxy-2-oxoglutarate aldolase/2-dehydro-3-deoxy-phosphogluconate aldolase [Sphaerochaeta associata]